MSLVFLGKTLYSHSASLHSGPRIGTGECNAVGDPVMDWHPIQGRAGNTPGGFMLQKPETSAGFMSNLARIETLPF